MNGSKSLCTPVQDPQYGVARVVWRASELTHRGVWRSKRKPRANLEGMAMLVLSRKKNESIIINNDITIVVVEIRGDKVRLGVDAPKEIPVHRREVYDAIQRNEAAAKQKEADASKAAADASNTAGDASKAVGDASKTSKTAGE